MRKFAIFILSIIIVLCSCGIGYKYFQYHKDSKTYSGIQQLKPKPLNHDEPNDMLIVPSDKNNTSYDIPLMDINDEYKFWISIDNTNIDYPVVQHNDNKFYLNHDFNKDKSIGGSIFIDSRNDITTDKNLVIYGHNMKNKSMFNNLKKFESKDFFLNSTIEILTNSSLYNYDVFSVYKMDADDLNLKFSFSNNDEYLEYLNTLSRKSLYSNNINLDSNTCIITLITCSYEFEDARTVVHAIRSID